MGTIWRICKSDHTLIRMVIMHTILPLHHHIRRLLCDGWRRKNGKHFIIIKIRTTNAPFDDQYPLLLAPQNPPHHGARSTINYQSSPWSVRGHCTSTDLIIFLTSRDAKVNVLALSDIKVADNPNRLTNLQKLRKNDGTVRSGVSSR